MVRCPRCGKEGSLHKKKVKGGSGKEYTAWYVAHSVVLPNGKRGVRWHHIPRSFIELIEKETIKHLEEGERFYTR